MFSVDLQCKNTFNKNVIRILVALYNVFFCISDIAKHK